MALEKFGVAALAKIDEGRIGVAFDEAIKRCEADCKDRPALKEARKITLTATIVPSVAPDGEMESCDLQLVIKETIPDRKTRVYNAISKRGGLYLNELSPDDARQLTLDEKEGPRKAVGDAR